MMPLYAQIETILTARPAILELTTDRPVADLVAGLALEGHRAVIVDRAPVFDKQTLLHALYQGCGFPAYFGFNWDALADALMGTLADPSDGNRGAARPALILMFQDFDLLQTRDPEVAQTFLDIVSDIGERDPECLLRLVLLKR